MGTDNSKQKGLPIEQEFDNGIVCNANEHAFTKKFKCD